MRQNPLAGGFGQALPGQPGIFVAAGFWIGKLVKTTENVRPDMHE
jgi:hypothetical protein